MRAKSQVSSKASPKVKHFQVSQTETFKKLQVHVFQFKVVLKVAKNATFPQTHSHERFYLAITLPHNTSITWLGDQFLSDNM